MRRVLFLIAVAALALASCTQTDNTDASGVNADAAEQIQDEVNGMALKLTSPAFEHNAVIPEKFTCDGEDVNPELSIEGVPSGAKSLVLIMDDPDAPPKVWEHWTVINIPPTTANIPENTVPEGKQLTNDFRKVEWGGPCPPPGKVHHYNFKLYALDTILELDSSATKEDVEEAMQGHVIEETVLIGTYER